MPSNSLPRETTGSVERERRRIVGRHFKQKPLRPAGTSTGNEVLQQHAGNAVAAPGGRDAERQDLAFGSETLIEQHAARRAVLAHSRCGHRRPASPAPSPATRNSTHHRESTRRATWRRAADRPRAPAAERGSRRYRCGLPRRHGRVGRAQIERREWRAIASAPARRAKPRQSDRIGSAMARQYQQHRCARAPPPNAARHRLRGSTALAAGSPPIPPAAPAPATADRYGRGAGEKAPHACFRAR